jgi:hypothetical protein
MGVFAMASKGSFLGTGEFLSTGDWLTSPNNLFYAVQQDDGNFCVYYGSPQHNRGVLWASMKYGPKGQYFAVPQDDGNFVVYQG